MELIAFPFAFILWYVIYDMKPERTDEIGLIWEEETLIKRIKIKNIINENR